MNKARMYGNKNEDGTPKEKRTRVYVNTLAQTYHTIKSNDVDIQVPSLAYVKGLEQSVKLLIARIEKLERQLNHALGNNIKIRQYVNRHNSKISALELDLENKIDRREY